MKNFKKEKVVDYVSEHKGQIAKVLAFVGAVGAGAALFVKRDKVKHVAKKWLSKFKRAS
jgi:hypothetical protein